MNIKIYLGGRGWFESSLVMNIKIYLESQGWFESSLVMNIKINLRGWGWFESSLLVMNIQIHLGGWERFESSLVMNIKIYLGYRGWFESSLVMNIKIYLGGQGWFGRTLFFSSPSSGPDLWKIPGFTPSIHLKPIKMAAHNRKRLISTILQKTREIWTVYTNIFVFSYLWSFRSSLGARCFWFCKLMK